MIEFITPATGTKFRLGMFPVTNLVDHKIPSTRSEFRITAQRYKNGAEVGGPISFGAVDVVKNHPKYGHCLDLGGRNFAVLPSEDVANQIIAMLTQVRADAAARHARAARTEAEYEAHRSQVDRALLTGRA